jgi:hypothetical protein
MVSELIRRANASGISISRTGNDLRLVFRDGIKVEGSLLEALKANKQPILDYIVSREAMAVRAIGLAQGLELEGRLYYDVTWVQRYWLDENEDREYKAEDRVHGTIRLGYRITGDLDVSALREAVAMVVRRHESLRASFHKIDGSFRMRVEDACSSSEKYALRIGGEDLAETRGFSFTEGPLFKPRLVHTGEKEYLLTLTLAHVISDTWSNEVLVRDLLIAYRSLVIPGSPRLLPLKYQWKDLLAAQVEHKRAHYEAHRCFWKELYPGLPDRVDIPGRKRVDPGPMGERERQRLSVVFSDGLRDRLLVLSKEYGVTIFVLLQATFITYISRKTGARDILAGTAVSGRDFPETYDQIGSYARNDLIRVRLEGNERFAEVVEKVRIANENMQHYRAFTLGDAIREMMAPGESWDPFWKFCLNYLDISLFHGYMMRDRLLEGLNMEMAPVPFFRNPVMPMDMFIDFVHANSRIEMNVQYDSSGYEPAFMEGFLADYLRHAEIVAAEVV